MHLGIQTFFTISSTKTFYSKSFELVCRVFPQIYIFHIYTGPKFTQNPDLHGTQIYTNPDLHRTHIYTAQIYTNPFSHIDSKKPKFTQPKIYTKPKFTQPNFTQNPNLHKTFSSNFAQTTSSEFHYQPWLVQKRQCPCSRSDAQR